MTSSQWTPPDNPDPSEILQSAVDDKREGLYEQALAKFLWFHHNALKHYDGLSGVRLSFALGYWWNLAAEYIPAGDAFVQTRNATEAAFRQNLDFDLFNELASLNQQLGDEMRTADLFTEVANSDEDAAGRLYHVAERYLIGNGRYHECGPLQRPEGPCQKIPGDIGNGCHKGD